MNDNCKIAVVGLGYVGLPLAVHFGEKFDTVGFDLKETIIANCLKKQDPTGEVSRDEFERAGRFIATSDPSMLSDADYIVVAVPTPIDKARRPDLNPVEGASRTVGRHMKKGALVIFESTVYPGVTEELCVPILERESGLKWKTDFHVGYSPERINPGDKEHTLTKIVKVVSGDDEVTLNKVADLYESIVTAGVHRTKTIKEAEAAKVIENTQRDLNIALMNGLARVGVLGLTFKEDCPDLRNTRVIDIISELKDYGADVLVHDPMADAHEARAYYDVELQPWEKMTDLGALIIAVPHRHTEKYPCPTSPPA